MHKVGCRHSSLPFGLQFQKLQGGATAATSKQLARLSEQFAFR